jgi:hypothetical protein
MMVIIIVINKKCNLLFICVLTQQPKSQLHNYTFIFTNNSNNNKNAINLSKCLTTAIVSLIFQ